MTNKKMCENDDFVEFHFFGFKNLNPVVCKSDRTVNYLRFLEWDTEVKSYFQPDFFIRVEYGRVEVSVRIDLWVNLTGGEVNLIHFKTGGEQRKPADHPAAYAQCRQFCRKSNLNFQVVDQTLPEDEPLTSSIRFLWNYAMRETHSGLFWLVNKFFSVEFLPDVGEFKRALANFGYDPDLVYTLLFHHHLEAELAHFPVTNETQLGKGTGISNILLKQIKPTSNFDSPTLTDFEPEIF